MAGIFNAYCAARNWRNRVARSCEQKMGVWWQRFNRWCRPNLPGLTVVIGVMAIVVAVLLA
ncbi:hypothetical protein [Kitasatospora sp. NPDC004272]